MLRRATLLVCLLPGIALGQITAGGTVTAMVTTQGTTGRANRVECASTTSTATWNIAATGITVSTGDKWRLATLIQAGNTGCSTTPPAGVVDVLATGATQSITLVPVQTMGTAAGIGSCTQASDVPVFLCAYYLPGGATSNAQVIAGTFTFQLAVPPTPTIDHVTPGDTQLAVTVVPGTRTATETAQAGITYQATCAPPLGSGLPTQTSPPGNAGDLICSGLTNNVAYTVTVQGQSEAGNMGPSSLATGPDSTTTPLPFLSFWEIYKDQGGVEQGGCSTGGAGSLVPALALLGLLAIRRRRP
jgi:MYXO-CTERM domain-containing protein